MKLAPSILAILLAGCETMPRNYAAESNMQVCEAVLFAPVEQSRLAGRTANARNLDCTQFANVIAMERQRRDAARNAAINNLIRINQRPPPTECTSHQLGGIVRTTCN